MSQQPEKKQRFQFVDQFRGLVGVLMLLGHSSYYFNSIWERLDPLDPLVDCRAQFILRYIGYLCAPGFLMMAGAMVWWSYQQRVRKGTSDWTARWQLIQRGIFLVIVQMTWVNSSWGGFNDFQPWHLGIIACIGISMIFLTLIIRWHWLVRFAVGVAILLIHPFLLRIQFDPEVMWVRVIMETFITSGDFNKYPVLPWFALATLGSGMASGWLKIWKTDRQRILISVGIGLTAILLALIVRMGRGFGNIFPFADFATFSFFFDQKYPPSLFMNLLFFGLVVLGISVFITIGKIAPKILVPLSIPGKVPLFFYTIHLAILGIFVKRLDLFYRDGGVVATLVGFCIMLAVMLPLCTWFYGVKSRSSNYFIKMI
jgi:uncharacterized membrane protein